MSTGLDGGAGERERGVEERSSAVDHHRSTLDRPTESAGVVSAPDPSIECVLPGDAGDTVGAATGRHGGQATSQQLIDDEAARVTGGAVDQDSFGCIHATIVGVTPNPTRASETTTYV
ncbi:hypothetical protein PSA01_65510 [Pseudonocardia saturnea]|uniref:Uncharacterized protein n=1 Tax=Pseudonocardia saturnea TaxID=33909 RepID=A0ABQ0S9D2_9PSEU|nr:hypothetical protein Pdca_06000 [Pseudonocardia autotrophica]GEC29522.1 hypothetical protein PSA01_65510 [Pseudonocardia saturnea]